MSIFGQVGARYLDRERKGKVTHEHEIEVIAGHTHALERADHLEAYGDGCRWTITVCDEREGRRVGAARAHYFVHPDAWIGRIGK